MSYHHNNYTITISPHQTPTPDSKTRMQEVGLIITRGSGELATDRDRDRDRLINKCLVISLDHTVIYRYGQKAVG